MFIKFDRFILILIYYISPSTFLFLFVYDLNTLYYLVALSKNEKHNYINFGKTTTIMIFETNKNLGTKLFKKKKKKLGTNFYHYLEQIMSFLEITKNS